VDLFIKTLFKKKIIKMENKILKVGQQSLLGYLPAIVIKSILDGKINWNKKLPSYYSMHTVSLFADISGFTKLSESFAKKGRIGPEFLAFSLNRYMEQLSILLI
jgi:adenylate cyclase 10